MAYISSVGIGLPQYHYSQDEVKSLVYDLFSFAKNRKLQRMLSVFDHAEITSRQLAAPKEWYKHNHSFSEKNKIYTEQAVALSVKAIDHCLQQPTMLTRPVQFSDIDLIVFVSSTGIATPSIDAYLINERPFNQSVVRLPIWGLGCAGGAMGLARASDWLKAHPEATALVVCCELCSLTFQLSDQSLSNIVGTALFGDGVSATLLIGKQSKYVSFLRDKKLSIERSSSYLKNDSLHIMGWEVNEAGLKVIFSKQIPKLIDQLWKDHFHTVLAEEKLSLIDVGAVIAHPGGRKVLEEMERVLEKKHHLLAYSYETLKHHGNMSSATVLYVLKNYLEDESKRLERNVLLCALGPGFSSEIVVMEWQ